MYFSNRKRGNIICRMNEYFHWNVCTLNENSNKDSILYFVMCYSDDQDLKPLSSDTWNPHYVEMILDLRKKSLHSFRQFLNTGRHRWCAMSTKTCSTKKKQQRSNDDEPLPTWGHYKLLSLETSIFRPGLFCIRMIGLVFYPRLSYHRTRSKSTGG